MAVKRTVRATWDALRALSPYAVVALQTGDGTIAAVFTRDFRTHLSDSWIAQNTQGVDNRGVVEHPKALEVITGVSYSGLDVATMCDRSALHVVVAAWTPLATSKEAR